MLKKMWQGLGAKIIAWFFVPTAIILVAVALVTFYSYQRVTEELVIARDNDLTRLSASQLAIELEGFADLLNTIARTPNIYQSDPITQQDALSAAGNRLVAFDGGVMILNAFGEVTAAGLAHRDSVGEDWSDRHYYLDLLRSHIRRDPGPVFSSVVTDGPDGVEVVIVAVPIIGEQGGFEGGLLGMLCVGEGEAYDFFNAIPQLHTESSGSIYVVDKEGLAIFHSDLDRIGEDFSDKLALQDLAGSGVDTRRLRDSQGREILTSVALIPGTSWRLVIEESWTNLMAESLGYQRFLLLLLTLGVIVPAVVVAAGVKRLMQPIRALINAAQEVARGNFGQTIQAKTGDEIEDLARQFNLMSAQLQDSYTSLEQRVYDRTKELATLNTIAAVMSRSLDLEEILNSVLDKTLETLEIEAGGIYLLHEDEQILSLIGHRGFSDAESVKIDKLRIGEGHSGAVVQTGEPSIVGDIAEDARLARQAVLEWGFRSLAVFPLVSRDRILGTLFVTSKSVREFSQQDIELLTSIGRQSGAVVENAWLFAQAEQRLRELESLYTADERLYRHLDLDQVLQALVDVAVNILHADKSSFYVWNDDTATLEAGAACGFYPEKLQTVTYALGEGCIGKAAMNRGPMLVEDTASHPDVIQTFAEEEGIRSAMHLPITVAGDLFGVFNIFYAQPRAFGKEDQRLFKALVQRAALVIENAQLYEQTHEAAALQERQRLARELHDAVTQTLFSASLIAEVMPRLLERNPEEGWKRLEELRQLTRGALAEMRTLLVELRPSSLIEAELSDLLHQLAEASTGRTGVQIEVNIEGERECPVDVKVAFYRIAQEAVNNVVKHAGASRVVVSLIQRPEMVRLTVQDNGRGFDPAEISSEHLGLGIMRERVDAIGADLTIDTEIGRGTEVFVEWRGNGP